MRHDNSLIKFKSILSRAKDLISIAEYISDASKGIINTSDLARSSVVTTASGFDLLAHDVIKDEVLYRSRKNIVMKGITIPIHIIGLDDQYRDFEISNAIHEQNSHKSFMDPAKLSQALSCFCNDPWQRIARCLDEEPSSLKNRMREFYRWRNRIVHEADIDPSFAGTTLWPIRKEDAEEAIALVDAVGSSIPQILD